LGKKKVIHYLEFWFVFKLNIQDGDTEVALKLGDDTLVMFADNV